MKKMLTTLFSACCLLAAPGAGAQQGDQAAQMKAWQDYMTPGEVHQMLAKSDGQWKTETKMWMEPGAAPMTSEGTSVNRMILGGRYQESIHKSVFMGKPFEGRNILGYDNIKKVFTSTWIDNMGTGTMVMEGAWDAPNHLIEFKGRQVDPMTGKDMDMRENFRIVNDNLHVMEMFSTMPDGGEMKIMEITFTRVPAKKH